MLAALKNDLTDCSPAKQRKLIRFVSSTCKSGGGLLANEHLSVLAELVEPLIDGSDDHSAIVEASKTFARLDFAPRSLILKFAHKEIDVAAPVLEHSIVLQDDDLVNIIEKFDSHYCRFIARRVVLTSTVTDTMIANADMVALTSTINNPGATFSDEGYKELATIGSVDETFGQALYKRADMPQGLSETICRNLGIENEDALAFSKPRSVSFKAPGKGTAKLNRESSLYLPSVQDCIARLNKNETTLDDCILDLAHPNGFQAVCQLMAYKKQQTETKITAIFNKVSGMQFVQLCNGLKLSETAFAAVAKLRVTNNTKLPDSQIAVMVQQYSSMADMRA